MNEPKKLNKKIVKIINDLEHLNAALYNSTSKVIKLLTNTQDDFLIKET